MGRPRRSPGIYRDEPPSQETGGVSILMRAFARVLGQPSTPAREGEEDKNESFTPSTYSSFFVARCFLDFSCGFLFSIECHHSRNRYRSQRRCYCRRNNRCEASKRIAQRHGN